jgi:hypothetical protein
LAIIVVMVTLAACLLVFAPLGFFCGMRLFAANALIASSYVLGAILWIACALITFSLWGWIALIIGLVLFGLGIVPMAMLALAIDALWVSLCALTFLLVATFAIRFLGFWYMALLAKAEDEALKQSAWRTADDEIPTEKNWDVALEAAATTSGVDFVSSVMTGDPKTDATIVDAYISLDPDAFAKWYEGYTGKPLPNVAPETSLPSRADPDDSHRDPAAPSHLGS